MSTVQMPTPPEGHYWKIGELSSKGYARVYLMKRRFWWFDDEVEQASFELSTDEHANALKAAGNARYALGKWRKNTAGFNGLTGYVDHKGVTR